MVDLAAVDLHLVETLEDVQEFTDWLARPREGLAIDTETGGLEWWRQPLRLVQFGDLTAGWAVPWQDWGGLVKDVMRRYDGKIVMHNAKFDERWLRRNSVTIDRSRVYDTQAMAHILDSSGRKALKSCGVKYIDARLSAMQGDLKRAFTVNKWDWLTVPVDFPDYWLYAALDTVITASLFEYFWPKIQSQYQTVFELESAATWVVSDLEERGAAIDIPYCERKYEELTEYVATMTEYIERTYGCGLGDDAVRGKLQQLGFSLTRRTNGGKLSVDKDVLEAIDHPFAQDILSRRQAQKMASAYFRNLLLYNDNGVVHPDIDLLGADTSRMSISRPALQQVPSSRSPAGTAVRDAFVAREGHKLVDIDYDQEEQRLVAHFSEDEGMAEAFREADSGGADFFTQVARQIFHDPTLMKDDVRRQRTKNAAYAKAYGAGPAKFAVTARVSEEEAEQFFQQYDSAFPKFPAWQRSVQAEARREMARTGQPAVYTPWGRRLVGDEEKIYAMVNYKIQGTAADVLKQKLVDLDCAGLAQYAVLPVHDELLFDVPEDEVEEIAPALEECMRETERFRVPLACGASIGDRWGQIH